jgi:hypothetical protein
MKVSHAIALLAVAATLGACSGQATPEPAPTTIAVNKPAPSDLGTSKTAGPYSVVLMSPKGELKPGDAEFMAHVTKDGKDVTDAKVSLDLTMPSMNMDGPHAELKHTAGNAYDGTANVMASPYAAKVSVTGADGKSSTAEFDFTVQ